MADANTIRIRSTYQDGVASGLKTTSAAVKAETSTMGSHFSGLASKIESGFKSSLSNLGGALSHAKGQIMGLAGAFGILAGGAGALGLIGVLKSGIDTANTMSLAIEKLTGLTGESAQAMSGLIAVTGKFGITSDQLGTIVGFEEKTTGKLAETMVKATKAGKSAALQSLENEKAKLQETGASTKLIDKLITEQKARDAVAAATNGQLPPLNKLQALQKQYGVTLTNAKGQALDFSQVLNNVSDYYQTNATEGQKAALASTVFGKGYTVLLPVLKLGSKGFAEAQAAAEGLGLTLNDSNEKDLKNYQETMRNLGDAVGGFELQLSLALLPALQDVAKTATNFIGDPNNRRTLLGFFNGLIQTGRDAAAFITGTIVPDIEGLAKAAQGFWAKIPGPLQDIIIKGFVADRAIKFLFGFDPLAMGLKLGESFLASVAGKIGGGIVSSLASAGIGKAFVQPVFVTNPGFGGVAGASGDAVAGGEVVAGAEAAAAIPVALVGAAFAAILGAPVYLSWAAKNHILGSTTGDRGGTTPNRGDRGAVNYQGTDGGNAPSTASSGAEGMRLLPKAIDYLSGIKEDTAASIAIGGAILKEQERADAHQAAEAARGRGEVAHQFLLAFRSGDAKVTIADFPKELAYLSTASDAQKKTPTYLQGLRDDEKALKKAMVGATDEQKIALGKDLVKVQNLIKLTTAAVGSAGAAMVGAIKKLPGGGFAAASGVIGHTTGPTNIGGGVMGEAGGETFAILSHPRSIPNGGGQAQSMSMPSFIPVPVPMSWTPGQQQSFAQQAGPALARWMQSMGLLPKFGTPLRG